MYCQTRGSSQDRQLAGCPLQKNPSLVDTLLEDLAKSHVNQGKLVSGDLAEICGYPLMSASRSHAVLPLMQTSVEIFAASKNYNL